MGKILCKCCGGKRFVNRVETLPSKEIKILVLGSTGSGKTEIGFFLSKGSRNDFNPTNGVKTYQVQTTDCHVNLTEIGGNQEMQKIWHYYYATAMGIVFCFDMTRDYEELRTDFELLRKVMAHCEIRGKPILMVGVKSDVVDEGLQLYDIENVFQLERVALGYQSSLRLCHFAKTKENSADANGLLQGFNWLVNSIAEKYNEISIRLEYDMHQKTWRERTEKLINDGRLKRQKYRRFPTNEQRKKSWILSKLKRPHTAPPVVYSISSEYEIAVISTSNYKSEQRNSVPNHES